MRIGPYDSRIIYVYPEMRIEKQILEEAHNTRYSVHPGDTKMYKDLRKYF